MSSSFPESTGFGDLAAGPGCLGVAFALVSSTVAPLVSDIAVAGRAGVAVRGLVAPAGAAAVASAGTNSGAGPLRLGRGESGLSPSHVARKLGTNAPRALAASGPLPKASCLFISSSGAVKLFQKCDPNFSGD